MQSFMALACLLFELAGGGGGGREESQNPFCPFRFKKKHLSPLILFDMGFFELSVMGGEGHGPRIIAFNKKICDVNTNTSL